MFVVKSRDFLSARGHSQLLSAKKREFDCADQLVLIRDGMINFYKIIFWCRYFVLFIGWLGHVIQVSMLKILAFALARRWDSNL